MGDKKNDNVDFSGSGPVEYEPAKTEGNSALSRLLGNEESRLLAIAGVNSVGIGVDPTGRDAIVVGVVDAGVASSLPKEINNFPVIISVTGEVDALPHR